MYEYVVTAGPGIMLVHGIANVDWLDAYFLEGLNDNETVIIGLVDRDTKVARFH